MIAMGGLEDKTGEETKILMQCLGYSNIVSKHSYYCNKGFVGDYCPNCKALYDRDIKEFEAATQENFWQWWNLPEK